MCVCERSSKKKHKIDTVAHTLAHTHTHMTTANSLARRGSSKTVQKMQHTFRHAAISLCLAQMNTSPPARQRCCCCCCCSCCFSRYCCWLFSSVINIISRPTVRASVCRYVCVRACEGALLPLISAAKAVSSAPQFVGVLGVAYLADISFVQWTANFRCRRRSSCSKNIHNNNNDKHSGNNNNFGTISGQLFFFHLTFLSFSERSSIQLHLFDLRAMQICIWHRNIGKPHRKTHNFTLYNNIEWHFLKSFAHPQCVSRISLAWQARNINPCQLPWISMQTMSSISCN